MKPSLSFMPESNNRYSTMLSHVRLRNRFYICLLAICCLSGCVANVWTGMSLAYNRHGFYKKVTDFTLSSQINALLFNDRFFKTQGCSIDATVFNQDVLVAGHVPTLALKNVLEQRLSRLKDYRHLYQEVTVQWAPAQTLEDSWITTTIRSQIFADPLIDPTPFKVITVDGIVYLMGEVRAEQANQVIRIARTVKGVKRVVTLLTYYQIGHRP